jgi:predicted lipoprotein with Yx(FWY)xxD motif
MTIRKIIAASGFVIAAGVAGCSGHHEGMEHHMMDANYMSSGSYMRDTSAGKILTTPDGMTVYSFDKDTPGASSCYGDCAEEWTPVTAAADAQPFGQMTVIARSDGTHQWAYNGMPLYHYDDDEKPGDVEGDGENGVWHVVK